LAKAVGFDKYCHMLKQVAIYLVKPFFQNEFCKNFAINLPNPKILIIEDEKRNLKFGFSFLEFK